MKNRELEFRAWTGLEMVYHVTVGVFGAFYVNPGDKNNGLDPNDSASLTPFTTRYSADIPIMQFTGLQDENRNYIFESDLCTWGNIKYVVEWNTQRASFILKSLTDGVDDSYMGGIPSQYLKVVGNIHENPELL